MKLRIKGSSIRCRLTQKDVELIKEGYLEEKINFAGIPLVYALQLTEGQELTCSYIDNKITLNMPRTALESFDNTDVVGYDNQDGGVYLLVQKDFTCLDEVEEDQSDNYPNPLLQKQKG
jgi:hypothetical protein